MVGDFFAFKLFGIFAQHFYMIKKFLITINRSIIPGLFVEAKAQTTVIDISSLLENMISNVNDE
jgi:hypothetical protein